MEVQPMASDSEDAKLEETLNNQGIDPEEMDRQDKEMLHEDIKE
jgi:hypothetical protein